MNERELLRHASFLQSIARSLLSDEHLAQDVVQDTLVAAVQARDVRDLRGWLPAVTRNLSRKLLRREARRLGSERQAARPESLPSTRELAIQAEAQRRVAQAVLDLDEPYTSVVLLRYFHHRTPMQIAKQSGEPVATTKTRLRRALQQLRGRLDSEYGGDGRAWCLALLPLAAHGAVKTGSVSTLLTGALVMKSKLVWVLALSACVGLGLVWSALSHDELQRRGLKASNTAEPDDVVREGPLPGLVSAGAISPPKTPVQSVVLEGRITLASNAVGEPVRLELRGGSIGGEGGGEPIRTVVSSGKRFSLEVGALFSAELPVVLLVTARHEQHLPRSERHPVVIDALNGAPLLRSLDITLERGGFVSGAVLAPNGSAAPHVKIVAYRMVGDIPAEIASSSTVTRIDGRYRLDVEEDGDYLVVAVSKSFLPASRVAAVRVGRVLELHPLVLPAGETISGRVTRTGGHAAAGAEIAARLKEPGLVLAVPGADSRLSWTRDRIEHAIVSVQADGQGQYRLEGLYAAVYGISVMKAERTHYGVLLDPAGPRYTREASAPAIGLDFEIESALLDVLVRHGGEGIEGVSVDVTDVHEDSEYGWIYSTQRGGRFTVHVRPGATHVLEVGPQGFAPQKRTIRSPASGGNLAVIFDLQRSPPKATLAVLMKPLGEPPYPPLPPVYRFELTPANGGRTEHVHATARRTRYVLPDLAPGDYRLTARAGGVDSREGGFYLAAEARVQLIAGRTTESVIPIRPGGRLKVILRSPDGRTDVSARCWLETLNGERVDLAFAKYGERGSTVASGRIPSLTGPAYARQVLRPATYRLHVEPRDEAYRSQTVEARIEAGKTTTTEIDLERSVGDVAVNR